MEGGVHASEVFVMLLSKGVLTRPWWYTSSVAKHAPVLSAVRRRKACVLREMPRIPLHTCGSLLEIHEAVHKGKPIVFCELSGKQFSFELPPSGGVEVPRPWVCALKFRDRRLRFDRGTVL